VRRENSAPPSVSYSSDSNKSSGSSGDSSDPISSDALDGDGGPEIDAEAEADARLQDLLDRDVGSSEVASSAPGGHGRAKKPCKGKRMRYRNYMATIQDLLIENPDLTFHDLTLPMWVNENPRLIGRVEKRIGQMKAKLRAGTEPIVGGGGRAASKRKASPGAPQPHAKRQAKDRPVGTGTPAGVQSIALSSPTVAKRGDSPGAPQPRAKPQAGLGRQGGRQASSSSSSSVQHIGQDASACSPSLVVAQQGGHCAMDFFHHIFLQPPSLAHEEVGNDISSSSSMGAMVRVPSSSSSTGVLASQPCPLGPPRDQVGQAGSGQPPAKSRDASKSKKMMSL